MKKFLAILIMLALLAVAVGGGYLLKNRAEQPPDTGQEQPLPDDSVSDGAGGDYEGDYDGVLGDDIPPPPQQVTGIWFDITEITI